MLQGGLSQRQGNYRCANLQVRLKLFWKMDGDWNQFPIKGRMNACRTILI